MPLPGHCFPSSIRCATHASVATSPTEQRSYSRYHLHPSANRGRYLAARTHHQATPRRAQEIDTHNPVRLIRAIEIAEALGSVPSLNHRESPYETLSIGLELSKEELTNRINQRIQNRLPSLFDEIKKLRDGGVSFERLHAFGLEYRYGAEYLQGHLSLNKFKETLATKTWQFAKRQLTWFKANPQIHWFDPIHDTEEIIISVRDFLNK
jgi:tRNA dimethylallyltransferase